MRATPLFTAALTISLVSGIASAQDKTPKAKAADKAEKDRIERIESRNGRVQIYGPGGVDIAGVRWDAKPRAMIGVSTSSSGARDTLGLLVTSVTAGGPAEKAGIIEGNRIASVNGVNLRLAAADAGQDDMEGITARRLTRELGKLTPGADVDLRVYADGQWKNVKVKTVSSDSLMGERFTFTRSARDDRAVLGFSLNSSGNKRDTLGVLIAGLDEDGPAEKAGLIEGDRVAAVNGTDLRVKHDDVGDDFVSNAMVSRFQRVMRNVKPGDKVELRVYSGGQTKTVTVTAARAADIYKEGERGFRMMMPGGAFRMAPMATMPPMPPMPAMPPRPADGAYWMETPAPVIAPMPMRIRSRIHSMNLNNDDNVLDDGSNDADVDSSLDFDSDVSPEIDFDVIPDVDIDIEPQMEMELQNTYDMDAARRAVDAVGKTETDAKSEVEAAVRARDEAKALNEQTRRMVESIINKQRSLERSQAKSASWTPTPSVTTVRPAFAAAATGSDVKSSTIRVAGLTLAPVTSELAEYLGAGSRDGFLVLESEGEWSAVHPGDVLLSVNGQCVRQSGRVATLDSEDAHDIVVLRKGQRMTVHLVGG
jgi:S1-C subfamily serine protease